MISGIITTRNRKDKVLLAVESVLKQTLPCCECIVVDDAGTDNTAEALAPYISEGKVKYIYMSPEETKGGNHARNVGIRAAKGEYIAFLDDDDRWLPDKNEKQMKLMAEDGTGACYCPLRKVYADGTTEDDDINFLKEGDLSKAILSGVICTTSSLLVKKDLLFDIGLFDENLRFWQEYDLCIRLFQKTRVSALKECKVLYSVDVLDPARLTNKLSGWERAVNYIKVKYEDLYKDLDSISRKEADIFLAKDGIWRSSIAKDNKRKRHYLWLMYKSTKAPKDLAKFLLNYGAKIK